MGLIVRQPNGAGSAGTPVTTAIATAPISVADMLRSEGYTVNVAGITTGAVQVQSSIDGSTWVNEGSALTADGKVTLTSNNLRFIRGNVTVATSVSIVLTVLGRSDQDLSK